MKIIAEILIEIRDRHGQLKSYQKREAKSFVKGLIDTLYTRFSNTQYTTWQDTGGTNRSTANPPNIYADILRCTAAAADTNFGIVAGTGTNAVAITDFALQTLIAHGTGAGQLSYGAHTFGVPSTTGTTRKLTISRVLTNNSGAQINVTELALYCASAGLGGTLYYFCLDRTLNSFSIGSTLNANITYTISVTV